MIGIIDCDIGNIGSINNIFSILNIDHKVVKTAEDYEKCDRFVFPGVGAFDTVANKVAQCGAAEHLETQIVGKGKYVLGICVGMQIMCRGSEEGRLPGFGWFDTEVKKFKPDAKRKTPHMGWNKVTDPGGMDIFEGILSEYSRFYFLHSYHVQNVDGCQNAITRYGENFTCAFQKDNMIGVQFHPEKSHKYGISLFKNFAELKS